MRDPTDLANVADKFADLAKPFAEEGARLLEGLLGHPCQVAGELLTDQIYWWQWRNRLRIAHKAKAILDSDGTSTKVVPPDFLLPLLEAAGNVEDTSLQDLWANLLAEGVRHETARHPAFVRTLQQMNGTDAATFDRYVRSSQGRFVQLVRGVRTKRSIPMRRTVVRSNTGDDVGSIAHLLALGLVRRPPVAKLEDRRGDKGPRVLLEEGALELTGYGRGFAKAVITMTTGVQSRGAR